jgi:hypothetical protein
VRVDSPSCEALRAEPCADKVEMVDSAAAHDDAVGAAGGIIIEGDLDAREIPCARKRGYRTANRPA